MDIVFRVDASLQIGTGHVMRCLTLADELRERGVVCRFVCREHEGNLLGEIRRRGYQALALPVDPTCITPKNLDKAKQPTHSEWLGADWITDADQFIALLGKTRPDWIIVDHYALDARWEKHVRHSCARIMVIDDLADRQHDSELLLDQNLGRSDEAYAKLVPDHCSLMIGPPYVLLRPEFAQLRAASLKRRGNPELRRILVTMGGVDIVNATSYVLAALSSSVLSEDCVITVVMGPHAPWLNDVKNLAARMVQPVEVLVNVSNMAELMAESDLAIGAAGSTSWERCCMGIPTVMLIVAANQMDAGHALEATGAVRILRMDPSLQTDLNFVINEFVHKPHLLSQMSECASKVCDGAGLNRVVDQLVSTHC